MARLHDALDAKERELSQAHAGRTRAQRRLLALSVVGVATGSAGGDVPSAGGAGGTRGQPSTQSVV